MLNSMSSPTASYHSTNTTANHSITTTASSTSNNHSNSRNGRTLSSNGPSLLPSDLPSASRDDNPTTRPISTRSPPPMTASNLPPNSTAIYSTFRNVSACNRCRIRKNRCDQRLPRCQSCEKARVHCVGYDPTTKREIPRSYVFFLESRLAYLEGLLVENGVKFDAPAAHEGEGYELDSSGRVRIPGDAPPSRNGSENLESSTKSATSPTSESKNGVDVKVEQERSPVQQYRGRSKPLAREINPEQTLDRKRHADDTNLKIDNLVSSVGLVPVHGTSDPRYLGSTSGISFARVVFAAVRSSVSSSTSDRGSIRPGSRRPSATFSNGGGTMRDSFFGLQSKPAMKQAPFPDQELALRLVNLYFEHANPQVPILHRVEFMELFKRVYSTDEKLRSPRDLYLLYIVCAIGAGIIFDTKEDDSSQNQREQRKRSVSPCMPSQKRRRLSNQQYQPEEYHASAVVHLESCLGSTPAADGFGGGLEELQAVLLLASFALLRPVAPGLWYIVGVAVRLAIDLGLHHEDGIGLDSVDGDEAALTMARRESRDENSNQRARPKLKVDPRERGRREFIRDLRRRLWWCVYSFDRLVSTCVGRPFGISDQVITTKFPSLLDDEYITKAGFVSPPSHETRSYKLVSHHYLKLRLLQSEIQQVLQYQQAKIALKSSKSRSHNLFMHTKLPSPFLQNFDSFRSWRRDIHRRLDEWRQSAPKQHEIGVQFSVQFLELNYWQALISLYRQSLTVPKPLATAMSPAEDVSSPSVTNVEESEDEDDIYAKVAEAGQKVLRIYRQLHRVRLVNYTYLATHHLFMAGISFLYAIWHSSAVRSQLTLDEVDFTVLAATSVLEDLMEKCPPAEACRDAFERMSKATVQMSLSTTGFGQQSKATGTQEASNTQLHQTEPTRTENMQLYDSPYQINRQPSHVLEHIQEQTPHIRPTHHHEPNNRYPPALSPTSIKDSRIPPQYYAPYPSQSPILPEHSSPECLADQRKPLYSNTQHSNNNSPVSAIHTQAQQPQLHPAQYTYSGPFGDRNLPRQQFTTQPTDPNSFYLSNLDFLDMPPRMVPDNTVYTSATMGEIDMASAPPYAQGAPAGTGLDLGFGMAVDFQHDWSENAGYDLFDGFFFGGAAGAGG